MLRSIALIRRSGCANRMRSVAASSLTGRAPALALAAHSGVRAAAAAAAARASTLALGARRHSTVAASAIAAASSSSSSSSPANTPPAAAAAAPARVPIDWPVGHECAGFRVVSRDAVPDFNCTLYRLLHAESGAVVLHIARADPENAFSVGFRTPVDRSHGVAHILEHTVLCGSERYPVRDPFFLLVRRSLKTFMNAMTAQDYTLYPFATCNARDFDNLMSVYLDAAFFPLIKDMDFKQEGHRVEIKTNTTTTSTAVDAAGAGAAASSSSASASVSASASPSPSPSSPPVLELKGVVYNEMKGAMSDTSSLFLQRMQESLFDSPDNPNHWNSGGDPAAIPELTHAYLREFHRRNYNLANAIFISYGDMQPPLQQIVDRVIEPLKERAKKEAAAGAAAAPPLAPLRYTPQPRFTAPRTVHATCSPDPLVPDPSKQTKVSISYLVQPLGRGLVPDPPSGAQEAERDRDAEVEAFGLNMLSSLLLDGPSSPMYRALIDPNLGSGYAPGTGFDLSTREGTFGFGLQGVADSDVDRVLSLVDSTLRQAAVDGFPAERVEAILHQIELQIKHVRSSFGVGLIMRLTPLWAHNLSPLRGLQVNEHIAALRAKIREGPYFQSLIHKHLLDNPHRVTLVMRPDAEYAAKESAAEEAKLAALAAQLTPADQERINAEAKELVRLQDKKQDTAGCNLPSLSAADIAPTTEIIHLQPVTELAPLAATLAPTLLTTPAQKRTPAMIASASLPRIVALPQPTNGVGYMRGLVSAKRVPLPLRPYLPLYTSFLTEVGAGSLDYRALSHALDLRTGGVSAELQVFAPLDDVAAVEEVILFRSMALQRNIAEMARLFRSVMHEATFVLEGTAGTERLLQLLLQTASGASSSLQDSGSSYATSDASAHLCASASANELYGGIKHVQFVNQLVSAITAAQAQDPPQAQALLRDLASKLAQISEALLSQGLERVFIVGDEGSLAEIKRALPDFLAPRPKGVAAATVTDLPFTRAASAQQSFYALPLAVHNVSLVLPTVSYLHADAPKIDVMAKLLSSVYLHREVREKGGAYGASLSHNSDGILAFSSYRDPNTLATLEAYRAAPRWLRSGQFEASDIDEALLSIFSGIDAPKPPAHKGLGAFLFGLSNEQRQAYRSGLLRVTRDDVVEMADKYLSDAALDRAHVTIVGDETRVPAEIKSSAKWNVAQIQLAAADAGAEGEAGEDEQFDDDDNEEESEQQQQQSQSKSSGRSKVGAVMSVGVAGMMMQGPESQDDEEEEGAHSGDEQHQQQQQPAAQMAAAAVAAMRAQDAPVTSRFAPPSLSHSGSKLLNESTNTMGGKSKAGLGRHAQSSTLMIQTSSSSAPLHAPAPAPAAVVAEATVPAAAEASSSSVQLAAGSIPLPVEAGAANSLSPSTPAPVSHVGVSKLSPPKQALSRALDSLEPAFPDHKDLLSVVRKEIRELWWHLPADVRTLAQNGAHDVTQLQNSVHRYLSEDGGILKLYQHLFKRERQHEKEPAVQRLSFPEAPFLPVVHGRLRHMKYKSVKLAEWTDSYEEAWTAMNQLHHAGADVTSLAHVNRALAVGDRAIAQLGDMAAVTAVRSCIEQFVQRVAAEVGAAAAAAATPTDAAAPTSAASSVPATKPASTAAAQDEDAEEEDEDDDDEDPPAPAVSPTPAAKAATLSTGGALREMAYHGCPKSGLSQSDLWSLVELSDATCDLIHGWPQEAIEEFNPSWHDAACSALIYERVLAPKRAQNQSAKSSSGSASDVSDGQQDQKRYSQAFSKMHSKQMEAQLRAERRAAAQMQAQLQARVRELEQQVAAQAQASKNSAQQPSGSQRGGRR